MNKQIDTETLLKSREEKRLSYSKREYILALECFEEFKSNPSNELLKDASVKLIKSLEYKRNNIEAYVCLAYIFYLLNNNTLAIQYLNMGGLIDSNHPKINQLKDIILGISNEHITSSSSFKREKVDRDQLLKKRGKLAEERENNTTTSESNKSKSNSSRSKRQITNVISSINSTNLP